MLWVCFLGIVIGSFSLALVLSIMNGFEKVTHQKLQNIHAQIIMRAYGDTLNMHAIAPVFNNEFPEIIGYSPTIMKHGIIQNKETDDMSNIVIIKGIDPVLEQQTSTLGEKINKNDHSKSLLLSDLVYDDNIIIGKKLAESLDVQIGDQIILFFAPEEQLNKRKITFNQQPATVNGTFDTGIEDFDNSVIMCSFALIHTMWPDAGITQINIALNPSADEHVVAQALRERFKIEIYSWKDLYPALVSALKLEKYAMFFILALITLVASMNIISLQFMHITQKRGDIAILKSLGMNEKTIEYIFISIGFIITTVAALTGLLFAAIVGLILTIYPFISLPDAYYVTHLPIEMEWHLFALVFIVVVALGLIATWIPARRTRYINIADILRFDA
jgi:lipoprotein-releasing system permease protein